MDGETDGLVQYIHNARALFTTLCTQNWINILCMFVIMVCLNIFITVLLPISLLVGLWTEYRVVKVLDIMYA